MVTFSNSLVVNDKMSQRVGHSWVTDLMTKQRTKWVRRLCRMDRGNTQNCVVVPGASKTMAWCRGPTEAWTESSPLLPAVCVNLSMLFPSCGWSWVSSSVYSIRGLGFLSPLHGMVWAFLTFVCVCGRQVGWGAVVCPHCTHTCHLVHFLSSHPQSIPLSCHSPT